MYQGRETVRKREGGRKRNGERERERGHEERELHFQRAIFGHNTILNLAVPTTHLSVIHFVFCISNLYSSKHNHAVAQLNMLN